METNFAGFAIDPAKCSQPSLEEKREMAYEISLWADNAPEVLQSWSRQDLRHLICAELRNKRKFTGVTKSKMIAHHLGLISLKKMSKKKDDSPSSLPISEENQTGKKKRKKECSLPLQATIEHDLPINTYNKLDDGFICQNLACQATLIPGDNFCRCSCCICHEYDQNKDPSLWLICNSDPPYDMESCGMSCHLKCILEHEKACATMSSDYAKVDGSFSCFCCGKLNWLLRCRQKQLRPAICARTVDQVLPRVSLCHEIVQDSEQYKAAALHVIVDAAAKKLKNEVGPFDKAPIKMGRCAVEQLACGTKVRNLLAYAATAEVDACLCSTSELGGGTGPKYPEPPTCRIQFENVSPVSVVVSLYSEEKISEDTVTGYRLWHRKSEVTEFSEQPTCTIYKPNRRTMISQLTPSTEYCFRVSVLGAKRDLGMCEARYVTQAPRNSSSDLSSQSSDGICARQSFQSMLGGEREENAACPLGLQAHSQRASSNSGDNNGTSELPLVTPLPEKGDNNDRVSPRSSDGIPFVCSKPDAPKDFRGAVNEKESTEKEYEYCVKVIRWLEREGIMERDFRVKFLTWFSLKATTQERRVVKAFIDVLVEEPDSLVDQLIDAFVDGFCTKEKTILQTGFCTRFLH